MPVDPTKPQMNYPAPPMPPSGAPQGAALPPPTSMGPSAGSQTYGGVLSQPQSMLPTSLAPSPVQPGPVPQGTTPQDLLKIMMSNGVGAGQMPPAMSGPPGLRQI